MTPASPFFSIVVPAYNAGHFVEATLDSLLNQTFDSYEVVVVDDGSTDDTLARLRPYADRVTIIRQANQGTFVILGRDDAGGIREESQVAKRVRVVTSVDWFLRD